MKKIITALGNNTLNNELKKYGNKVESLPQIIALNKIDLVDDQKKISSLAQKIE